MTTTNYTLERGKTLETLTARQAKMVIEYFAAQAAEDAPEQDDHKHMWMTRMQASLAIERQISPQDWYVLVVAMSNLQSFDRDPAGYLFDRGHEDTAITRENEHFYLNDQVSWKIDTAYACSGE